MSNELTLKDLPPFETMHVHAIILSIKFDQQFIRRTFSYSKDHS